MLALEIFGTVVFVYGLLSLLRDIINENTYKKISDKMKIYITLRDIDQNIEYYIREIYNIKKKNDFKNITIINLDKNSDRKIIEKLNDEEMNLKIMDYDQFSELINKKENLA